MARRTTKKAKTGLKLDFSNVSKAFEPGQEYAVRVTEATLEEGSKAPYFNLKLQGVEGGEYENSTMYHRASTSESSLWRLRPLLEAFGFEIPDGALELDAEDFIGREAMCSTYLDRYDGGSSVKPDEFWALDSDGSDDDEDEEEEAEELDLDELSDDQLVELAKALGIKASTAKKAKAALKKADEDELAKAWAAMSDEDEEEEEEEDEEEEEEEEKPAKKGKASSKKKKAITEDDVQEMSEEELEELIEQFELDVDLSDFKTLRKMKNAVIDAMEEGGHFEG